MTERQAALSPALEAAAASATAAEKTVRLSRKEGLLYSIRSWRDRAATCSPVTPTRRDDNDHGDDGEDGKDVETRDEQEPEGGQQRQH